MSASSLCLKYERRTLLLQHSGQRFIAISRFKSPASKQTAHLIRMGRPFLALRAIYASCIESYGLRCRYHIAVVDVRFCARSRLGSGAAHVWLDDEIDSVEACAMRAGAP